MGYENGSPAYRIWDLEARKIRIIFYNFVICHEGYYPFREKVNWHPNCFDDPSTFSPIVDGVLATREWKKFNFDADDANEIFRMAPGLVGGPRGGSPDCGEVFHGTCEVKNFFVGGLEKISAWGGGSMRHKLHKRIRGFPIHLRP